MIKANSNIWTSDSHCKLERETEGVSTEATVSAGQWSGHSVLSPSPYQKEEGMFGGVWRETQTIITHCTQLHHPDEVHFSGFQHPEKNFR